MIVCYSSICSSAHPITDTPESRPTAKDSSSILEWAEIAGVDRSMFAMYRIWCIRLDPCLHQRAQGLRLGLQSVLNAPSAALCRNLANVVVALPLVLGSRSVEMSATQISTIHGLRAFRLAKVS